MGIKLIVFGVVMSIISCYSAPQTGDTQVLSPDEHMINNQLGKSNHISLEIHEPTMKDNAAHFIYYQDDPHIIHWREWWYLNLETVTNERLVVFFLTAGDLNNPLTSLAMVIMVFMQEDGSTFWTMTPSTISEYTPDYEKCNVTLGDNWFATNKKDTYQIHYQNDLHSLKLDLTLTKSRQGIKHGDCTTALGDWEFMGWCIPVSYGETTGLLSYRDQSGSYQQFNLTGHGYHDHNWGLIQWNTLSWDWGAFSSIQFPFSIIYGQTEYNNGKNGNINIVNETQNYSISYPELTIDYCEWTKIGWQIRPSKIWLHGKSANVSINMTIDLKIPYIIGIKDFGHPYLLGAAQGHITIDDETYNFSDIWGFYEFHIPPLHRRE
jgi:hypothetical protein